MANYLSTVLYTGQAKAKKEFEKWEFARKNPTVMGLALKNQSISIPDAQALRTSMKRQVDVGFLKKIAKGSATAKTATHTGVYGDSSKFNVTYVTHVETFSVPAKLGENQLYENQDFFNHLYAEAWRNLRTRHDDSALAFVLTKKNQLSATVLNPLIASAGNDGSWNDTNFAYEINADQKALFMQVAKKVMSAKYLAGPYDVIADLAMMGYFEYQMNQGSGNYANTSFQFDPSLGFAVTQDVIDSNYVRGNVLMMPKGALAGLNWNEPLNRSGFNAGETTTGILDTIEDPFGSSAIADLSIYTNRADTSADTTNGNVQDIVHQYELALTIGYVAAPLSTTNDSTIFQFSQGV